MISEKYWTGGIVGDINGRIINCYNTGTVNGYASVGGIAGVLAPGTQNVFENCYSIGDENPLVGENDENASLKNNYTKKDTFSAIDLGSSYKEDKENINNGYPILFWE